MYLQSRYSETAVRLFANYIETAVLIVSRFYISTGLYATIIKKKLKLDDDESSVAVTSSGSITQSTVSVNSKTVLTDIMKTICSSDPFHLEKSKRVLSVLLVVRNWQTKLWFQVS
jgi:hypothetical protein